MGRASRRPAERVVCAKERKSAAPKFWPKIMADMPTELRAGGRWFCTATRGCGLLVEELGGRGTMGMYHL